MPTPATLFSIIGWIMISSVAVFFLSDSRIPWCRIAKKIAIFIVIGIVVMFVGSMIIDFLPEK
jgi:phage-related holin